MASSGAYGELDVLEEVSHLHRIPAMNIKTITAPASPRDEGRAMAAGVLVVNSQHRACATAFCKQL